MGPRIYIRLQATLNNSLKVAISLTHSLTHGSERGECHSVTIPILSRCGVGVQFQRKSSPPPKNTVG